MQKIKEKKQKLRRKTLEGKKHSKDKRTEEGMGI